MSRFPGLGGKKRFENKKTKINKHEKQLAQKLGGKRQLASGATAKEKGDIKLEDFLLDSKETIDSSIKVKSEDLAKIQLEAQQRNKYPGLILKLKTGLTVPTEWAMIPLECFKQFLEQIKESRYGTKCNGQIEGCSEVIPDEEYPSGVY